MFECMTETCEAINTPSYHVTSEGAWGARIVIPIKGKTLEVETIVADTETHLSVSEMATRLDAIGQPTTVEDYEVSFDPDDYSLF